MSVDCWSPDDQPVKAYGEFKKDPSKNIFMVTGENAMVPVGPEKSVP